MFGDDAMRAEHLAKLLAVDAGFAALYAAGEPCQRGQTAARDKCIPARDRRSQERIDQGREGKERSLRKRRGSDLTPEQKRWARDVRGLVAKSTTDPDELAVANALDNADFWAAYAENPEAASAALSEITEAVRQGDFSSFQSASREAILDAPQNAEAQAEIEKALQDFPAPEIGAGEFVGSRFIKSRSALTDGLATLKGRRDEVRQAEEAQARALEASGWDVSRTTGGAPEEATISRPIGNSGATIDYTVTFSAPGEPWGDVGVDADAFAAYARSVGAEISVAWSIGGDRSLPDEARQQAAVLAKSMWAESLEPNLRDGTVLTNEPIGGPGSVRARLYERSGFGKSDGSNIQRGIVTSGKLTPLQMTKPGRQVGRKADRQRRQKERKREVEANRSFSRVDQIVEDRLEAAIQAGGGKPEDFEEMTPQQRTMVGGRATAGVGITMNPDKSVTMTFPDRPPMIVNPDGRPRRERRR